VLLMSLPLMAVGPSPARRAVLTRRVRWFGAATITYNVNVNESIIAITDGTMASSTALIGFGLDTSSRYRRPPRVAGAVRRPRPRAAGRTALRIIAVSFFALAAYVSVSPPARSSDQPRRERRHQPTRSRDPL
jgi:hypothetical protein